MPRLTLITTNRSLAASTWQAASGALQRWALDSQRTACRNAMVAGTALAARRAEREEVEEFLAARLPAPRAAADDTVGDHTAHA